MQVESLRLLAEQLLGGELSVDEFTDRLSRRAIADVGVAQLDLDRTRRCGFPEVVFGQGKSVDALTNIFEGLLANGIQVLATRISAEQAEPLLLRFDRAVYNPVGRIFRIPLARLPQAERSPQGHVGIITAGTSDLPVAEEARETADWMGVRVTMVYDVGVAGPHRLPARLPELAGVDALVVIAGMEGALPSVVGGYVDCPVIAVPTSVGYGANLGGIAALLSMLNSCAANVTVVNIDAGFKGAYVASLIARKAAGRNRAIGVDQCDF
ncbi:MAG TPA: nickel pincer cofactor biosynthesis protein LarB [Pirellulales bacterium]|nr:nickel pincer cofactor biosynthesis protein LarB [Pirellulales bacterium]